MAPKTPNTKNPTIQKPTGTRDFFPEALLKRRYVTGMWRDAAIRHGFDEIDGPTFEHLSLYTKKSGEGIVSELFSFRRTGGKKDFALRPELTPTVARMFSEKANSLPKPTKWFSIGPFFRAERPQRGRLREFLQWNLDSFGLPGINTDNDDTHAQAQADAEVITTLSSLLSSMGLSPDICRFHINDRKIVERCLCQCQSMNEDRLNQVFQIIDRKDRMTKDALAEALKPFENSDRVLSFVNNHDADSVVLTPEALKECAECIFNDSQALDSLAPFIRQLSSHSDLEWYRYNSSIVRGLAYYTGTVFEVIADGERAVAGGGRYDKLIELFGGPPTPAVGFAMGDVVLSLLLEDKGLMPEGKDLAQAVSQQGASVRPDVFVIASAEPAAMEMISPTLTILRTGVESLRWQESEGRKPWDADRYEVQPMHARRSYKTTTNIGKLLKDALAQHARYAAIIESAEHCTLKNLDTGEQQQDVPLSDVAARVQTNTL